MPYPSIYPWTHPSIYPWTSMDLSMDTHQHTAAWSCCFETGIFKNMKPFYDWWWWTSANRHELQIISSQPSSGGLKQRITFLFHWGGSAPQDLPISQPPASLTSMDLWACCSSMLIYPWIYEQIASNMLIYPWIYHQVASKLLIDPWIYQQFASNMLIDPSIYEHVASNMLMDHWIC